MLCSIAVLTIVSHGNRLRLRRCVLRVRLLLLHGQLSTASAILIRDNVEGGIHHSKRRSAEVISSKTLYRLVPDFHHFLDIGYACQSFHFFQWAVCVVVVVLDVS